MKFTRLRLLGFKSFVEPTDFLIEPGLTGVVGPERLRQVQPGRGAALGHGRDIAQVAARRRHGRRDLLRHRRRPAATTPRSQSTSTTPRATRRPNSTSTIRSTCRAASSAMQGSTYRINGREVRARDVHILFADASTGARSPALVHQGRIGEIIQAKPEQRRRVLEEAAGISGLHARRHEAELRLRAAEHNLERLEEVINQLAGQIDGLKRQARQAVRYRNISAARAQGGGYPVSPALGRRQRRAGRSQRRQEFGCSAGRRSHRRAGRGGEAASHRRRCSPRLRDAEVRAAAALQRLNLAREALEREETRARERMAELNQRLLQLEGDIERERRLAADATAALERLGTEEQSLLQEAQAAEMNSASVAERVAKAEATLSVSERAFDELTGTIADLTARRHAFEKALAEHSNRLDRLTGEARCGRGGAPTARRSRTRRSDRPCRGCGSRTSRTDRGGSCRPSSRGRPFRCPSGP